MAIIDLPFGEFHDLSCTGVLNARLPLKVIYSLVNLAAFRGFEIMMAIGPHATRKTMGVRVLL